MTVALVQIKNQKLKVNHIGLTQNHKKTNRLGVGVGEASASEASASEASVSEASRSRSVSDRRREGYQGHQGIRVAEGFA